MGTGVVLSRSLNVLQYLVLWVFCYLVCTDEGHTILHPIAGLMSSCPLGEPIALWVGGDTTYHLSSPCATLGCVVGTVVSSSRWEEGINVNKCGVILPYNGLYYQVFPETSSVYWTFHSSSVLFIGARGTLIGNLEVFPFAFLLRNICQVATDAGYHGICSNLTLLWDLLQLEWPCLVHFSHFSWGDWDQGAKGSCPTPPTF